MYCDAVAIYTEMVCACVEIRLTSVYHASGIFLNRQMCGFVYSELPKTSPNQISTCSCAHPNGPEEPVLARLTAALWAPWALVGPICALVAPPGPLWAPRAIIGLPGPVWAQPLWAPWAHHSCIQGATRARPTPAHVGSTQFHRGMAQMGPCDAHKRGPH